MSLNLTILRFSEEVQFLSRPQHPEDVLSFKGADFSGRRVRVCLRSGRRHAQVCKSGDIVPIPHCTRYLALRIKDIRKHVLENCAPMEISGTYVDRLQQSEYWPFEGYLRVYEASADGHFYANVGADFKTDHTGKLLQTPAELRAFQIGDDEIPRFSIPLCFTQVDINLNIEYTHVCRTTS